MTQVKQSTFIHSREVPLKFIGSHQSLKIQPHADTGVVAPTYWLCQLRTTYFDRC